MFVIVIVANEREEVKVCEVYAYTLQNRAWQRFKELRQTYGGANVYWASREVQK